MVAPIRKDDIVDDTSAIQVNVSELSNKYISVIESYRSNSSTALSRNFDDLFDIRNQASFDQSKVLESRAHTFYRMIGFPVVAEDGSFYSPGYKPSSQKDIEKNNDIAKRVSKTVIDTQAKRENDIIKKYNIFDKRNVQSVVYALSMGSSNIKLQSPIGGIKSFLNFTLNGPLDKDEQSFSLPNRKNFINDNYTVTTDNYYDKGFHILKPFVVNPNIADAVMPSTKLICAPFLENTNNGQANLKRPIIELVLRLRLKQKNLLSTLSQKSIEALSGSSFLSRIDSTLNPSLISSALFNLENVNDSVIQEVLKNRTTIEILTINNNVRTIKGLIKHFVNSLEEIESVRSKISYVPLPFAGGPEAGSELTNLVSPKVQSALESNISSTKLLSSLADNLDSISATSSIDISSFVLGDIISTDKAFNAELAELEQQRSSYQKRASDALKDVEIIVGEISGLGLIDILAIYTALWSMNLSSLLGLIDDEAFERMRSDKELQTQEVLDRASGGGVGVIDALSVFQENLYNILSFCDKLVAQSLASPTEGYGGSLTGGA
jgi:hypothetical protein